MTYLYEDSRYILNQMSEPFKAKIEMIKDEAGEAIYQAIEPLASKR